MLYIDSFFFIKHGDLNHSYVSHNQRVASLRQEHRGIHFDPFCLRETMAGGTAGRPACPVIYEGSIQNKAWRWMKTYDL